MLRLADALEKGDVLVMRFTHPFTGGTLKRTVTGKGHYVEEIPGGWRMEVKFSGERLELLVAYFRSVARAEELEIKTKIDLGGVKSYVEWHDGKEVFNPLSEAMAKNTGEVTVIEK